DFQESADSFLL
nr:Chain C, EBOV-NP2 [Ebola virus sp.]6J2G_F Chain F, EBOV-NP2 [Ebola virus sp.]